MGDVVCWNTSNETIDMERLMGHECSGEARAN